MHEHKYLCPGVQRVWQWQERCTFDGLDFRRGKVGATPVIAAWCLRVDAGSQTLSYHHGRHINHTRFLSPLYTLVQVAPTRRDYFHRASFQDTRVLRASQYHG
jgi:hypothetical protein